MHELKDTVKIPLKTGQDAADYKDLGESEEGKTKP